MNKIKLTAYSHGAGCGCKLSPGVLSDILKSDEALPTFQNLLVGNETKDDAAVVDLDGKTAIISTTDFFMPIVDDPFDFGAIAATNAISDIYAMGGEPVMAIAILGWPIDKIPAEIAAEVMRGGRSVCHEAGIPLAGGHSIDALEPIFGLAVTGKVPVSQVKKNSTAQVGDWLYLTKPLGVGIITTAQKKNLATPEDMEEAKAWMKTLNSIGAELGEMEQVHALTDVTGFGLGGHLIEVCEAANLSARVFFDELPLLESVAKYLAQGCIPGGTNRNWKTYGDKIQLRQPEDFSIMADPQTSGGLLIAVAEEERSYFESIMEAQGYVLSPIGQMIPAEEKRIIVQ